MSTRSPPPVGSELIVVFGTAAVLIAVFAPLTSYLYRRGS